MAIFYGSLSLFGDIVGRYFFWQAHYCFKFNVGFLLFLLGVGLLIFGYSFCEMVQRILNISEQPEQRCGAFLHGADQRQRIAAPRSDKGAGNANPLLVVVMAFLLM